MDFLCIYLRSRLLFGSVWTRDISLERELETEQGFRYDDAKKWPTVDEKCDKSSFEQFLARNIVASPAV
jgi:hypothetical protein